jgi:hypothetical protein
MHLSAKPELQSAAMPSTEFGLDALNTTAGLQFVPQLLANHSHNLTTQSKSTLTIKMHKTTTLLLKLKLANNLNTV